MLTFSWLDVMTLLLTWQLAHPYRWLQPDPRTPHSMPPAPPPLAVLLPPCHSLRKLTFSAQSRTMENIGPMAQIAHHLVSKLSSLSSLTCLCLSGMRIVNGNGVQGNLVHPALRRLILDDTESSGVTVRCAGGTCWFGT